MFSLRTTSLLAALYGEKTKQTTAISCSLPLAGGPDVEFVSVFAFVRRKKKKINKENFPLTSDVMLRCSPTARHVPWLLKHTVALVEEIDYRMLPNGRRCRRADCGGGAVIFVIVVSAPCVMRDIHLCSVNMWVCFISIQRGVMEALRRQKSLWVRDANSHIYAATQIAVLHHSAADVTGRVCWRRFSFCAFLASWQDVLDTQSEERGRRWQTGVDTSQRLF